MDKSTFIYRVRALAGPETVRVKLPESERDPDGWWFFIHAGQELDVTEDLTEERIDPSSRVMAVWLAELLARHEGITDVFLDRQERSPWLSVRIDINGDTKVVDR